MGSSNVIDTVMHIELRILQLIQNFEPQVKFIFINDIRLHIYMHYILHRWFLVHQNVNQRKTSIDIAAFVKNYDFIMEVRLDKECTQDLNFKGLRLGVRGIDVST